MDDYNLKLQNFVNKLTTDQKMGLHVRGYHSQIEGVFVYSVSGRKFDKVIIQTGSSKSVRYFVDRADGSIYGARSHLAPNLKWYFGTIDRMDRWNWSDYHGRPINDDQVRVAGQYGPYTHYMPA